MFPCFENNPVDAFLALARDAGGGPNSIALYGTGDDLTNFLIAIMTMSKNSVACFGKPLATNITFEHLLSFPSFEVSPGFDYIPLISKSIILAALIGTKIFSNT